MKSGAAGRLDWRNDAPVADNDSAGHRSVTNSGKDTPMGPQELFQRVRSRLRAAVGEDVFTSWFARLELE